ncbi:MAG: hypothetical protein ILP10_04415 [Lachnospiraceae bacterium]|nr:hypothetical protein [Lachnospiraceae bacterium]
MSANRTTKRITACVMAIMMLAIMLFSAFFVAHEMEHDCTGEDCPVCACIEWCENALHRMGAGLLAGVVRTMTWIAILLSVCLVTLFVARRTPVSGKVRIND